MKSKDAGLIVRAIVSKIFNLCAGHDPPTLQTDRRHVISWLRFAL